jgi:penicillin-insensitive murein endopeptidase
VLGSTVGAPPPKAAALEVPPLPDLPAVRGIPSGLNDRDIARRLATDPKSFGALSIGRPNRGALFNAVAMPEGPLWRVVDAKHAFGTEETVGSIARAIQAVNLEFPGSPPLYVGNISALHGGYLRPHRSHQSGRDVDLGYYYVDGAHWYVPARAQNLDRARTWALLDALSRDPNIDSVFMDRSVQHLLSEYAGTHGVSQERLFELFDGTPSRPPLVRHVWGHLTHLHARFRSPVAEAAGARTARSLVAMRRIPRRKYY